MKNLLGIMIGFASFYGFSSKAADIPTIEQLLQSGKSALVCVEFGTGDTLNKELLKLKTTFKIVQITTLPVNSTVCAVLESKIN